VKSGTVDEKVPERISQREFYPLRIIVFALNLEDINDQRKAQGPSPMQAQTLWTLVSDCDLCPR